MVRASRLKLMGAAVAAVAGAVASRVGFANTISVNLNFEGASIAKADTAGALETTGYYWNNNPAGNSSTYTSSTLYDNTGSGSGSTGLTTATFSVYYPNGRTGTTTPTNTWPHTGDGELFSGCILTNTSSNGTLTVSTVPYATYDLYVYLTCETYASASISDQSGLTYYFTGNVASAGGVGPFAQTQYTQIASTDSTSPTAYGDYAVFHETASTASISYSEGAYTTGSNHGDWLYGFQIVDTTGTPEPASLSLLGMVGGAALLRRRRRDTKPRTAHA